MVKKRDHSNKVPLGQSNDDCKQSKTEEPNSPLFHHLPLDVISKILSRLKFKEAAGMSILSTKWRWIWRRSCQNLVFTKKTMFSTNATTRNQSKFIANVNSVLRQLRSTTLHKFVAKFRLRKPHARHVNRWVALCAKSRAKHIVFDFSPWTIASDQGNRCSFPLRHFSGGRDASSSVRSLSLVYAVLEPPPRDFCGFTNLKRLKLDGVSVPGHLQCLLPVCSVLEWLSVVRCTLHGFRTSQPLQRLQYLFVEACEGMHKIELRAPNLATFKLVGEPVPILLHGCLALAEATLLLRGTDCFDYTFAELPRGIPHVRKLSVHFFMETQVQGFARCPSRFINVRHLVLTPSLVGSYRDTSRVLRLACLLELAPVLEQLELHMECYFRALYIDWLHEELLPKKTSKHMHLRTVHMTGVYGIESLLLLALHIARNAMVLERLVIDPMVKESYILTRDEVAQKQIIVGRKAAKEHLQGRGIDHILTII